MKRWKEKRKKVLSLVLAFGMVLSSAPAYGDAGSVEAASNLLAHYEFAGLDGNVASGTSISDSSGNGHNATAKGNNLTASDGILTLPGGSSGSSAGYVELPKGMFNGQENLTISIWMKNETGSGDYTGFYIGSEANSSKKDFPTQYFILNPKNPSGVMKAVLTNSLNMSRPFDTEVGVGSSGRPSDGPATNNEWALYTVVIAEDSLTGYLNGVKHKTYDTAVNISTLGNDLLSYIGKSSYPDKFYKGGVKDFKIYTEVLTDTEIMNLYLSGVTDQEILENAKSELNVPEISGGTVNATFIDQVTLETSMDVGKTVDISWASSHPAIISANGAITDPGTETEVTLTATLSIGETNVTKEFKVTVVPVSETTYSMVVNPSDQGVEISQELIGLFYEDINSAADGGLYPEMVKNYSFENYFNVESITEPGRGNQYSWKLHWVSDNDSNFVVEQDSSMYLNENNTNYAKITGNMNLLNGGFAPMNNPNSAAMPITKDAFYDFSIQTRADASYEGKMTVKVVNEKGEAITDEKEIDLTNNGDWCKTEQVVLTGTKTQKGKLSVTISGAKASDVLYMDMVSLSPQDTYGYGDRNYAYGKGIRKDLVDKLAGLDPSFIRFPGGCIIEGNQGRESYYNWEWSVGPLEERKQIGNHWASDNGSYTNTYGYMQSFGFGYHEILQLCEDFEAEAFPILSAGVFCQFANDDNAPAASGEELDKFARHATNLIDYCWGSTLSDNPTQREWALKRVQNGRQNPFNLNYIGIGNENWQAKYLNNFEYIKDFVEDYVKENYPGREIIIISSSGPGAEDSSYQFAWDWLNEKDPGETLVDEHYYVSKEFMLNNDDRYDYYLRLEDGGSDVFLGEYATHLESRTNNLESAICDAAYLTGVERNADIVRFASYAPLFEKIGSTNWSQNLIHFDEYDSVATTNYYVQQMYAQNYGEQIVNTTLNKKGANYTQNTGSPILGTWDTAGYVTDVKVTRADGVVLLEDDFTSNDNGWAAFPDSKGSFTIADGKLTFTQANGMNCVWLPEMVNNPEWYDYKVEATVVKTGGAEGFLIGAGAKDSKNYYWYNMGGWQNSQTVMQRARTDRGSVILGNNFKYGFKPIKTNEEMKVTVNYGIDGKLEGGYVSETVDKSNDFSGSLRPYQNDIYQVCSRDEEYIYLKLVNHDNYAKDITLSYPCELTADTAEALCLSGKAGDVNAIGNERIVPVTSNIAIEDNQVKYLVPAMSFTVIKVAYDADKVINISSLKRLYDTYKNKDLSPYTEESAAVFQTALEAAETVLNKVDATQEAANQAASQLEAAVKGLILKPADVSDLQDAYSSCKDKDVSPYTEESVKVFEDALKAAKAVLDKENPTQKEVDQALDALKAAEKALKQKTDTSDLQNTYNTYKSKDVSSYTEESVKVFQDALKAAETILKKENATQEEIDQALEGLKAAEAALQTKPVETGELKNLYNTYKGKDLSGYTAESAKGFQDALKAAEAVLNNPKATQEEVSRALASLKAAEAALTAKPVTPTVTLKKGETFSYKGLKYQVTNASKGKETVMVTGATKKKVKTVSIPAKVPYKKISCKVTAIKSKAFFKYTKLNKVTIGKNVTTVGAKAFYGDKKLTRIIFKAPKLKTVKKQAFKGIHKKATIKVPKGKVKSYTKKLKNKGQKATVKIK